MYLKDELKDVYGKQFNLSQEQISKMSWIDGYLYSDVIISKRFEQLKLNVELTQK
jgi:hypothetical protein